MLVKDSFIASEQKQLKTECEIVWVKIEMATNKPLYVAAYYKPKDGDTKSAAELKRSLELADSLKGNIWLLGDFNYPIFSWNQDHVPTFKSGLSFPKHYEDFVNLLDNFSLVQMVSQSTRLDYFITSNPTLVNNREIHPGIADHDVVLVNANVKPCESKQIPRSIPLYKKTNWESFRCYIKSYCNEIITNHGNKDVEKIWLSLKTVIDKGISQFVPIKKIGSKRSLPWNTQEINRLIRRRDSLFQKQKKMDAPVTDIILSR